MHSGKKASNWAWLVLDALPVVVPTAVAVFGAVAIFFLLLAQFKPVFIWPMGLAAVAVATFVIVRNYPKDVPRDKARQMCNLLVFVGVLAWGAANIPFTSQHVLVNRDPALYSNAGIWLTNHDNLKIPALHIFGNVPGVQLDDGSGFKTVPGSNQQYLYAQGLHLLPAFLGLAGRIVGIAKALHLNVLFGMTALLGIYAFGRELVRRTWWAAVATGAVAVSMPLIYVSRESYSEPLAAAFTFGGLAMLWLALKSRRLSLWFLAGIVLGAGTMTRIDGFLTIAEIVAFLAILLALAAKDERHRALKESAAAVAGVAVTAALGWLDAAKLSTAYYNDLHAEFHQEILAITAAIVLGAIAVYLAWQKSYLAKIDKATKAWRAEAAAVAVIAVTLLLASRPFWDKPLDSTGLRTYAELSTQWVAWYIGAVLAVLGVIGIAVAAARVVKKQDLLVTAGLLVIIGTSLVYLVKPSIAPDQIWASRRLVPVILPGVALFGAIPLDWLCGQYLKKVKWGYIFAGLASVALVLVPLTTSKPVLLLRPFVELGGIDTMCAALPHNAAVLWLGEQPAQEIVQPTRDICNVPAQGYDLQTGAPLNKTTLAQLAKNANGQHKLPVVGTYANDTTTLPEDVGSQLAAVSTFPIRDLEHTYTNPPAAVTTSSNTIELGIIQPDGSVTPLMPRK